jgi:hypothetical protein
MAKNSTRGEADREQRIRERAYALWEADGRPHGADLEYWERARELVGMEENPQAGQLPNPVHPGEDRPASPPPADEAAIQENLGEFPSQLTDQGDKKPTPAPRRRKRSST